MISGKTHETVHTSLFSNKQVLTVSVQYSVVIVIGSVIFRKLQPNCKFGIMSSKITDKFIRSPGLSTTINSLADAQFETAIGITFILNITPDDS